MKLLMVLTPHDQLENTGKKSGFWLEEFAVPYYVFKDTGVDITLASSRGGQPPLDPKSDAPDAPIEATRRYKADRAAQLALDRSCVLSGAPGKSIDAVFYPDGTVPRRTSPMMRTLSIGSKPCMPQAIRCQPCATHPARCATPEAVIARRWTRAEKWPALPTPKNWRQLTEVVPLPIEDMLRERSSNYSKGAHWQPHVVIHGNLISGQNPASFEEAAHALHKRLAERHADAA